eukprot:758720-Hanusia_phi.AAC.4
MIAGTQIAEAVSNFVPYPTTAFIIKSGAGKLWQISVRLDHPGAGTPGPGTHPAAVQSMTESFSTEKPR